MLSKKEVRTFIDLIVKKTKKTQEEIAIEMGYASNYISDVLSPSGKITGKFITRLKKEYSDFPINPNIPAAFEIDEKELLRRHEARLIRIESALEVLGEKYAEKEYDAKGTAISQTLTELENEIKARYRIRLGEEKKKSS